MASMLADEPEHADAMVARRQRDRARFNKSYGRDDNLGFLNQDEGDQLLEDADEFRQLMKPRYDPKTGRRLFNVAVEDIQVWSDAAGAVSTKSWNYARDLHQDKLHQLRNMKEYEGWIKEDEEDVEGERVISDIKNLYAEQYFNIYF